MFTFILENWVPEFQDCAVEYKAFLGEIQDDSYRPSGGRKQDPDHAGDHDAIWSCFKFVQQEKPF